MRNRNVRQNDFRNIEAKKKADSSLIKNISLFSEKNNTAACFGGTSSEGAYYKQNKKKINKTFYLSIRNKDATKEGEGSAANEYFALEICLRLGIKTPKERFILRSLPKIQFYPKHLVQKIICASEAIENYIPIAAILPGKSLHKDPVLDELHNTYKLDIEKQVIIDLKQDKEYKISGNLFSADLAAILIADWDFQPAGFNLGLIKVGNRFYAAAIDKEKSSFAGKSFLELCKEFTDHPIFNSKTLEQALAIINEINNALTPDATGQCDFDKIFCNSRVKATEFLAKNCEAKCSNLKKSAFSLLEYYKYNMGHTFLIEFAAREKIRQQIADHVIHQLNDSKISFPITNSELQNIIIEDLRGPYYSQLFLNQKNKQITAEDIHNKDLLQALSTAIKKEFDVVDYEPTLKKSKS